MAKVNNHVLDGINEKIGLSRSRRWAEYKDDQKEKLLKAVAPTAEGAKVIAVQPADKKLALIGKGTKRDDLLKLGLKGAFKEDFNAHASSGFWKGAYSDIGLGWVMEEHPVEGGKPKVFCYYVFPEGINGLAYRDKKEKPKAEKAPAEKPKK